MVVTVRIIKIIRATEVIATRNNKTTETVTTEKNESSDRINYVELTM